MEKIIVKKPQGHDDRFDIDKMSLQAVVFELYDAIFNEFNDGRELKLLERIVNEFNEIKK